MKSGVRRKSRKKSRKSHKKSRKQRKSRRFGYSHDMGPNVYNVSQQKGGILLANNAFNWMGNPTARALMSGSG